MEIKIEEIIPTEVLENVIVTALEGGSNYWYYLTDDAVKLIRRAVPNSEEPCLSTAMLKAVLYHNVEVPIHDTENEDDILGYLSGKTLPQRLQELSDDDSYSWALENEIAGNGDADSSDVVFQYIVLGEVIFA